MRHRLLSQIVRKGDGWLRPPEGQVQGQLLRLRETRWRPRRRREGRRAVDCSQWCGLLWQRLLGQVVGEGDEWLLPPEVQVQGRPFRLGETRWRAKRWRQRRRVVEGEGARRGGGAYIAWSSFQVGMDCERGWALILSVLSG